MKPVKFLSMCFTLLFLFCLSYFILVDSYVIYKRGGPGTYQQFLLESFAGYRGKIILIGGSDLRHGINALKMERYFKVPVINYGDYGAIPLKHKILHLKKYLKPGDTVILPLNWYYYFEGEFLDDTYVKLIIDRQNSSYFNNSLSVYYRDLPFYERLKFVFSDLPFKYLFMAIWARPNSLEIQNRNMGAIRDFNILLKSDRADARGNSIDNGPKEIANDGSDVYNCDQYHFGHYLIPRVLRNLEEKGLFRESDQYQIIVGGKRNFLKPIRYLSKMGVFRKKDQIGKLLLDPPKLIAVFKYLEKMGIFRKKDPMEITIADKVNLIHLVEKAKPNFKNLDLTHAQPSETMLEFLGLLELIRETGAKIYFSWPIVVNGEGKECYKSEIANGIEGLASRTEKLLKEYGYEIAGDYEDSVFPKDCFLNTYAHIKYSCQWRVTERLISFLKEKGIRENSNKYDKAFFDKPLKMALSKWKKEIIDSFSGFTDPLPEKGIGRRQLRKYILFDDGWHMPEDFGIWSEGKESSFVLNVEDKPINSFLIEGVYFNGEEQTEVYLNGRNLGKFVLTQKELYIPMAEQGAEIFHVELKHENPISPIELGGKNKDIRNIKFGLTGIKVIYMDLNVIPEEGLAGSHLFKYVVFRDGWYQEEDWGVWSKGKESSFVLSVEDKPIKSLLIEGRYFNGEEQTEVYLNGRNLGNFVLTKRELKIPPEEQESEMLHVELKHKNPISPVELGGKNKDIRNIKFGLTGIKVIYDN